jgi:uncharacterized protein (TIGR03905 family)
MIYEYAPHGVCSRKMIIDIDNSVVKSLKVEGGCNGNLQGISALVEGMTIDEVIKRLRGIRCGSRPTSCPDQLAEGLEKFLEEHK